MKKYKVLENKILDVFLQEKDKIHFQNQLYNVALLGKPRPKKGECKTDVYLLLKNELSEMELKISVKMKQSNEFVENKISKDRAYAIFGDNYRDIVKKAARSLEQSFESYPLVYLQQKGNVQKGSMTMGWRFEIVNKPRKLSCSLPLERKDIIDCLYRGVNLDDDKKHPSVGGKIIQNAGIAEYILICEEEEITSYHDVFKHMQSLQDYMPSPLYISFISNNYRSEVDKIDGARALAVYVDWFVQEGKLNYKLIFDEPLEYTGKFLTQKLKKTLNNATIDTKQIHYSPHLISKLYQST